MIEVNKMTKKERCWYIIDNVLIQSEADDISSYLDELEHQVTELKESQKQKQIIRLCQRLDKAEQQNKELIEFAKEMREIGMLNPDRLPEYTDIIYHHANDLIKKYI